MSEPADKALLPAGMCDVLPPHADFEAETVERLIATFRSHGYQRVKPPLLEFEDSLLNGEGTDMGGETFRLMDPVSRRMMGLRPDMTLQVARIAATRLGQAPRPLRLSYAGQVIRVMGSQLRPERQFGQVGAELIGSSSPAADAEVITMAAEALTALGVKDLSVDLGQPTLVPAVCSNLGLDEKNQAQLRTALDRKDAAGIASLAGLLGRSTAATLGALLAASGPVESALEALAGLDLSDHAAAERECLEQVVGRVQVLAPDLKLTVDAVENRGFEYHTGVTFTFFAGRVRGELGRGGRYLAGRNGTLPEPASGFSLFMDSVLRSLPGATVPRRVFIPSGSPAGAGSRLRGEGWIIVEGLDDAAEPMTEARRMMCSHILDGNAPREVLPNGRGSD